MSCGSRGNFGSRCRWRRRLLFCGTLAGVIAGVSAADVSDIVAVPAAGQSADQLRRDRYECHNWVVAQNGTVPAPGPAREEAAAERRASRIGKVITGAAIGAVAGSVIRGADDYREADDGALAGGVLGAIAGAVIGKKQQSENEDDSFNEYFRALDACMTARGYELSIAGADD
jgi:gas vesicle protein